jgi:hypothetical protein
MLTLGKISDKQWREIVPRLSKTWASDDVKKKFPGDALPRAAGDAWIAVVDDELFVLRPGDAKAVKTDVPKEGALGIRDVAADGARAIVSAGANVREVDVSTLVSRVVFTLPKDAWARAKYLAGERAAIVQGSTLHFVSAGATWKELSTLKLDGETDLTVVRNGTILVTIPDGTYGGRPSVAYAVKPENLEEIARTDGFTHFKSGADECDGRVFVTDHKWKRNELLGLPGAATTKPAMPSPDDYIFYGESPNDWFEGANLGHVYELVFKEAPDEKTKTKIAELFTRKTSKGLVEAAPQPWMWSGRWALFFVGERKKGGDPFFEAMKKLIDEIHDVAPLAEAIFRGTRDDGTRYPRPPTPGPKWPRLQFGKQLGSTIDESLPMGAPDEAFEKARGKK